MSESQSIIVALLAVQVVVSAIGHAATASRLKAVLGVGNAEYRFKWRGLRRRQQEQEEVGPML